MHALDPASPRCRAGLHTRAIVRILVRGGVDGLPIREFPEARLKAVVLDLFGTLFPLEPLGKYLEAAGVPPSALKLWFARILRDAWALEVAGQYRPFREVAAGALEVLIVEQGGRPERKKTDQVLDAFATLPPHPDVKPSLERLRARGIRLASLGNGSRQVADRLFENAGLSALVETRLSIDEVKHWKPHPAAYRYAVGKLGLPASEVTLLAAHAWDVHGARRAGLRGAWVGRLEKKFEPAMGEPDLAADSIAELVEML